MNLGAFENELLKTANINLDALPAPHEARNHIVAALH
jgi:hypothetical protein